MKGSRQTHTHKQTLIHLAIHPHTHPQWYRQHFVTVTVADNATRQSGHLALASLCECVCVCE